MFEELERFPIKAGFSQQASCQICFSIISFNWDPRFCETYTCDLKLKFWSRLLCFWDRSETNWAPWAGPFTFWGFLGFVFHHQAGRLLSFGIRVTDRSQCWLRAIICQQGDHLPSVHWQKGKTFSRPSAIRETFSGASAGNRSPAETPGNFAWDKRQRGNKRNHWTTIGR